MTEAEEYINKSVLEFARENKQLKSKVKRLKEENKKLKERLKW